MWPADSGEEDAVDSRTSAVIAIAASVEDFRISANVAQVMGNTEWVQLRLSWGTWSPFLSSSQPGGDPSAVPGSRRHQPQ